MADEEPIVDYIEIDKRIAILQTIRDANNALIEAEEELVDEDPKPPKDRDIIRVVARNKVLAGDGVKSEVLGTISTPPTLDAAELITLGLPDGADIVAEVARLRKAALDLAPVAGARP
jgi:hypothetical protein